MATEFPVTAIARVERNGRAPVYQQIAEQLRRIIVDQHVGPGTKLPAEPVLVDRFGVSRLTVREGLRVLRDEGLLRVAHGIGVFVAAHSNTIVSDALTLPDLLELAETFGTPRDIGAPAGFESDRARLARAEVLIERLTAALTAARPIHCAVPKHSQSTTGQTIIDIPVDDTTPNGDPMTDTALHAAASAAANAIDGDGDGDVRLLLLSTNITGAEMDARLPEVRDTLAPRATAAALATVRPTPTTREELDALPAGTVVRSASGTIACRFDTDHGTVFGDERPFTPWTRLQLPVTVLWHPEDTP